MTAFRLVLRSRTLAHPRTRAAVCCLRALIVATVIVILADPVMPVLVSRTDEIRRHIVLIDTSRSMGLQRCSCSKCMVPSTIAVARV